MNDISTPTEVLNFTAGSVVFKQGNDADAFYIINKGVVACIKVVFSCWFCVNDI